MADNMEGALRLSTPLFSAHTNGLLCSWRVMRWSRHAVFSLAALGAAFVGGVLLLVRVHLVYGLLYLLVHLYVSYSPVLMLRGPTTPLPLAAAV
jgi:hypothetical protein